MHPASLIVYIYAVLVIIGGVIGFVKAGSRPSLIFGGGFGLALLAAGWSIGRGRTEGLQLALILIFAPLVFFSIRFFRSSPRAFMPGGLMAILSLLALVGVWVAAHGI